MSNTTTTDYAAITARQRAGWSTGDFNVFALTIMPVAESLVSTVNPRPGSSVLDVACGSGNAALVAARRFCDVKGVDFAPNLINRALTRAASEGTPIEFREADCQSLPFDDAAFDYVLSTFGVMFAPDQERAASELLRVCKPGGTIGLANWVPGSLADEFFRVVAKFLPPPPGLKPPVRWGTEQGARELFAGAAKVEIVPRRFYQRYRSITHGIELSRRHFGPLITALEAVGPERCDALLDEFAAVYDRFNRAADGTAALEGDYVEVVVTR